jgi:ABC-type bacteriocin/lantibiotic exporter with double-glycine peptidase domain
MAGIAVIAVLFGMLVVAFLRIMKWPMVIVALLYIFPIMIAYFVIRHIVKVEIPIYRRKQQMKKEKMV